MSPEIWPKLSASRGDSTFAIALSEETPATTARTVLWKAGSEAVSVRLWIRTASPAGCLKSSYRILSIRPDSPGPEVSKTICFIGETMLTANRAIESASQPKIAFLR